MKIDIMEKRVFKTFKLLDLQENVLIYLKTRIYPSPQHLKTEGHIIYLGL